MNKSTLFRSFATILILVFTPIWHVFAQEVQEETAQKLIALLEQRSKLLERVDALEKEQELFPPGAILISTKKCDDLVGSWVEFPDARGRFLVAVGRHTDKNGDSRDFQHGIGEDDGEYKHLLTEVEMPSHSHGSAYALNGRNLPWGPGQHPVPTSATSRGSEMSWAAGDNKKHNNVPPYIALFFCKFMG